MAVTLKRVKANFPDMIKLHIDVVDEEVFSFSNLYIIHYHFDSGSTVHPVHQISSNFPLDVFKKALYFFQKLILIELQRKV